jgi:hypothetical protein
MMDEMVAWEGHCLVKRLSTIEHTVRRAGRTINPMDGAIVSAPPAFDPALIPHAGWPISPLLLQMLDMAVTEAIAAGLTVCDGVERMVQVLADFGIFLSSDELVELASAESGICLS